ncbi:hypothetical protein L1049_014900 [Liquidambar formosana]|uniref:SCP domain-containing protein n=1 Tax=Liquidambar formosana TaxID=63359 RepID=A0AAP0S2Y6_LIQFO
MQSHDILVAIVNFMALTLAHVSLAQNSNHDYVDAHNVARAQVGVQPITWNDRVAAYAANYSNKRFDEYCKLEHSDGPYGENVAEVNGVHVYSAAEAVKLWVTEKPNYDHESNSCVGGECLHYTQVVWGDSIHVGCAKVECNNGYGWSFIICNYDPPGNIEGHRPY